MTMFDDYEPEDAWHPDDPPLEQVRNLRRRLALLFSNDAADTFDLEDELDVLTAAVSIARRRRLTDRDLLRADDLDVDIAYVRTRI